jgi:hypothetical protein
MNQRRSQNPTALENARRLTEVIVLFTEAPKNDRLAKSIYGSGHFINRKGWKMPASKNGFTEAVVNGLFSEAAVLRHLPR